MRFAFSVDPQDVENRFHFTYCLSRGSPNDLQGENAAFLRHLCRHGLQRTKKQSDR